MFRVRLSVDNVELGYQIRDLDQDLFVRIAAGELVPADDQALSRHPGAPVVYSAVWRTDTHAWENNLPSEAGIQAYQAWSQQGWA